MSISPFGYVAPPRKPKYPGQRIDEKYRRVYFPRQRGSFVEYPDGTTYEVVGGTYYRVAGADEAFARIRKAVQKKTRRVR